jgi:hypothetical protein
MFAWWPGDIVRPQMFEDDKYSYALIPVGIVVWFVPSQRDGIGILWSSDPDNR